MAKVKRKAATSKASVETRRTSKAAKRSAKPSEATPKPLKAKAKARATRSAKSVKKTTAAAAAPKKAAKAAKASRASAASIDVGSRAPSFALKDQSGALVRSAELSGKPYVLYFYPKDDTTGCTIEACAFRDSGPKFGARGVRVIGVSPDSEASHQRFARKYGLPFTLLSDPDKQLISAYGVWVEKQNYGRKYMGVQRSTFLIGADGRVQQAWRNVKVAGHVDAVLAATQG